jgi:hypothetical protein
MQRRFKTIVLAYGISRPAELKGFIHQPWFPNHAFGKELDLKRPWVSRGLSRVSPCLAKTRKRRRRANRAAGYFGRNGRHERLIRRFKSIIPPCSSSYSLQTDLRPAVAGQTPQPGASESGISPGTRPRPFFWGRGRFACAVRGRFAQVGASQCPRHRRTPLSQDHPASRFLSAP